MSIENEMAICESTHGMECVTHHVDLLNIIVQFYFGINCIGYLFMFKNIFSHRHQC